MMQGAALVAGGDPAAATPFLRDAAARSAGNPAALSRLGAIALHTQDAAGARAHYADALALAPNDADARMGLGLACLAAGDLAAGEAQLRLSLSRRFHAPALHHQLALLHASQGRWVEADRAVRTALGQHPGLPGAEALLQRVQAEVLRTALGGAAP